MLIMFLMNFRPFSVKKKISDFSAPKKKKTIPHGSPIVVFNKKNKEKIWFPMPTPKKRISDS